jgi:hypothetical protein
MQTMPNMIGIIFRPTTTFSAIFQTLHHHQL